MMGIKGIDFLDSVWTKAVEKGCVCGVDSYFAQDVLGAISCDKCEEKIYLQSEVNAMEVRGELPTPKISERKLNNWFGRKEKE